MRRREPRSGFREGPRGFILAEGGAEELPSHGRRGGVPPEAIAAPQTRDGSRPRKQRSKRHAGRAYGIGRVVSVGGGVPG